MELAIRWTHFDFSPVDFVGAYDLSVQDNQLSDRHLPYGFCKDAS
jgi:hypothetical protein